MGLSAPHILIFIVIATLLLGGGRISGLMGDVAKGIKSFKKGVAEEDDTSGPAMIRPVASLASPNANEGMSEHAAMQVHERQVDQPVAAQPY